MTRVDRPLRQTCLDCHAGFEPVFPNVVPQVFGVNRDWTSDESDRQAIAGTNRNAASEVAVGRFRQDPYVRINVWAYALPGLVERPKISSRTRPICSINLAKRSNGKRSLPIRDEMSVAYLADRYRSPKLRSFVDFLAQRFN